MRSMFIASLTAGAFLIGVSCERHDWEETKILHESHSHDEHGDGGHKEKGAGHDKDAGHEEGGSAGGAGH
jgi:hypothetical protein